MESSRDERLAKRVLANAGQYPTDFVIDLTERLREVAETLDELEIVDALEALVMDEHTGQVIDDWCVAG